MTTPQTAPIVGMHHAFGRFMPYHVRVIDEGAASDHRPVFAVLERAR